ncbi:MAG: hypothetical protein ACKOWC_01965 [Limnohabitans sp.]
MSRTLLRTAALPAAAGSLISLLAQATMALFLLRLFEPQAVGVFSVIAQVAFGWATLALAQSPVSLLANQQQPALPAARRALQSSLRRWLWLVPAAALAIGWSTRSGPSWAIALAWTSAMALMQMGWLLAQSLSLRIHTPLSIATVRMLPPALAAVMTGLAALALDWRSSDALTAGAVIGYTAGALWLAPALQSHPALSHEADAPQTDQRSERLKFVHTLSDVLVATALASHWSSLYGTAQAGALLILLRVTGFIPALVSTAWAQVVLSRPLAQRPSSLLPALAGVGAVLATGLLIHLALQAGWLSASWTLLHGYLWSVVLWQAGACLIAAVSHRPFLCGRSVAYTRQCLSLNAVQALLLVLPPLFGTAVQTHLWVLAGFLSIALSLQALWAARLPVTMPITNRRMP